jgi:hypothetical protein
MIERETSFYYKLQIGMNLLQSCLQSLQGDKLPTNLPRTHTEIQTSA